MNESAAMKFVLWFWFVMLSETKHLNAKEVGDSSLRMTPL